NLKLPHLQSALKKVRMEGAAVLRGETRVEPDELLPGDRAGAPQQAQPRAGQRQVEAPTPGAGQGAAAPPSNREAEEGARVPPEAGRPDGPPGGRGGGGGGGGARPP